MPTLKQAAGMNHATQGCVVQNKVQVPPMQSEAVRVNLEPKEIPEIELTQILEDMSEISDDSNDGINFHQENVDPNVNQSEDSEPEWMQMHSPAQLPLAPVQATRAKEREPWWILSTLVFWCQPIPKPSISIRVAKKRVNQLVPATVWKVVYVKYKLKCPHSPFAEDTLKEKLRESLKELKTRISIKENGGACLQDDEAFARLQTFDGYATRNVLKQRQNIIDGPPVPDTPLPSCEQSPLPVPSPVTPQYVPQNIPSVLEKSSQIMTQMTKGQMLMKQSSSFASLAEAFSTLNVKRDQYLESKMLLAVDKQKKQQLGILKDAHDFGVLSDVEFREQVKLVVGLQF